MNAPVLQWQIIGPDPERAANFFQSVFGWSIDQKNALGMRQVAAEAGGMPGSLWPAPPGVTPFVQLFIGVDDVEATVQKAQAQGAQVIVPVTALPDGDMMAVLRDPQGLPFGLMRRR